MLIGANMLKINVTLSNMISNEMMTNFNMLSSGMLHGIVSNLTLQKKRHIRDIFGRTKKKFCHTYDTSMTIIVTKPGIIIDVVGSYFYDKKS